MQWIASVGASVDLRLAVAVIVMINVEGSSSGHQAKAVSLGRLCFAAVIAPRGLTPGAASFLTICGSLANYKM